MLQWSDAVSTDLVPGQIPWPIPARRTSRVRGAGPLRSNRFDARRQLTLFTDAPPAAPLVIIAAPISEQGCSSSRQQHGRRSDRRVPHGLAVAARDRAGCGAVGTLEFEIRGRVGRLSVRRRESFWPDGLHVRRSAVRIGLQFPNTGGVQVPAAPGTGLLSIALAPFPNAAGRSACMPRRPDEQRMDRRGMPVRQRRTFATCRTPVGPVRIADVLVMSAGRLQPQRHGRCGRLCRVARDTLGQMGTGLAADGNGNGEIDDGDYGVWRANFGSVAAGVASSTNLARVPEPGTLFMLLVSSVLLLKRRAHFGFRLARQVAVDWPELGLYFE